MLITQWLAGLSISFCYRHHYSCRSPHSTPFPWSIPECWLCHQLNCAQFPRNGCQYHASAIWTVHYGQSIPHWWPHFRIVSSSVRRCCSSCLNWRKITNAAWVVADKNCWKIGLLFEMKKNSSLSDCVDNSKIGLWIGICPQEFRLLLLIVQRCAQPIQTCRNGSRFRAAQYQFFRQCQCPWEVLFQQFQTIIVAFDSANAVKHWEQMVEQDVDIFCRFCWSDDEMHIVEERFDWVQKVKHFAIEVSGKIIFFQWNSIQT